MLSQGHDYLGRSSGPSSLQVLTHNLNNVAYVADFVPQGSSAAPVPVLTISAGAQLEASKHGFLFTYGFTYGLVLTQSTSLRRPRIFRPYWEPVRRLVLVGSVYPLCLSIAYSALDQRAVLSREGVTVCECGKYPNDLLFLYSYRHQIRLSPAHGLAVSCRFVCVTNHTNDFRLTACSRSKWVHMIPFLHRF